ncbi:MAG: ribonucleoside-diphosphate reductase, adenosylcobalamin-dependent, partial [Alphaproteobacteria bacterium]|nr:ribonucleoside-diphosphate reductase, adenosylcobalamin-dependent [Alphaproteobacteria bacterium]
MPTVAPISQQIWDMKYRLRSANGQAVDDTIEDTWRRVADAIAAAEVRPADWQGRFYEALEDFRFLPAGRVLAGAGADRNVTLFNCFVMGTIPDDMSGIFENLREAALTMQQGGGIGYDFSTLRPNGAPVEGVGADASGPLTFMDVWDAMCRTIMSAGHRRGAMMATLRCDHPDIEAFIEAKQDPGRLRMFNLSVLVTDAFMQAIKDDNAWELQFGGRTYKSVQARELWDRVMRATYAYAEPGVIFIDRINQRNNLRYCETINSTNPCGEQPLPPYGACLLGSINLARLVRNSFTADAALDLDALR